MKVKEMYNTSAIIITHDIKCAKRTGDRLIILDDGVFFAEGSYEELEENSENPDSWHNYFFATRYAGWGMEEKDREQLLNSIIDEIREAIPDSYLYYYLKYYNGDRQVEYLEKALKLNPDCADLYIASSTQLTR